MTQTATFAAGCFWGVQLDICLICRKKSPNWQPVPIAEALRSAEAKILRLQDAGLNLSQSDRRIVIFGQLLTALSDTWARSELLSLAKKLLCKK
jgi:hypothetical protein